MAVPIEGFTVVVKADVIEPLLQEDRVVLPNNTAVSDGEIWRCSFMAESDASDFLGILGELGLNTDRGPDSDAVVVDEFDQSVSPYCEWLLLAQWDKAVIGWKEGSQPKTVTAKEGWDPSVGSGLQRRSPEEIEALEFLHLEGNVEVYRDPQSGEEIYLGRSSTPTEALFKTATPIIAENFRTGGQRRLRGEAAEAVEEAVESLERVVQESPQWWNAHWFIGKGKQALGDLEAAYAALRRAYELETEVKQIPQELAGVCLELGWFGEAVKLSESAVAIEPKDSNLLANLAVSYLLDARVPESRASIDAALRISPSDQTNVLIESIVAGVESGKRPQPVSLGELTQTARPVQKAKKEKKPFWKFWRR